MIQKSETMGAYFILSRIHKSPQRRRRSSSKAISKVDVNMNPLPPGYVPSKDDVILGRGKNVQRHPGNMFYQRTLAHYLPQYTRAKCKLDKSIIVSSVVAAVNDKGKFVREDRGSWFEASDLLVRERIGANLRDMLHTKYSSSTKSKKRRRLEVQDKLNDQVEEILERRDCKAIISRMEKLAKEIEDDDKLQTAFNQANMALLRTFKKGSAASVNPGDDTSMDIDPIATQRNLVDSLVASDFLDESEGSDDGSMEPIPM